MARAKRRDGTIFGRYWGVWRELPGAINFDKVYHVWHARDGLGVDEAAGMLRRKRSLASPACPVLRLLRCLLRLAPLMLGDALPIRAAENEVQHHLPFFGVAAAARRRIFSALARLAMASADSGMN
jgi:hypothetical protein